MQNISRRQVLLGFVGVVPAILAGCDVVSDAAPVVPDISPTVTPDDDVRTQINDLLSSENLSIGAPICAYAQYDGELEELARFYVTWNGDQVDRIIREVDGELEAIGLAEDELGDIAKLIESGEYESVAILQAQSGCYVWDGEKLTPLMIVGTGHQAPGYLDEDGRQPDSARDVSQTVRSVMQLAGVWDRVSLADGSEVAAPEFEKTATWEPTYVERRDVFGIMKLYGNVNGSLDELEVGQRIRHYSQVDGELVAGNCLYPVWVKDELVGLVTGKPEGVADGTVFFAFSSFDVNNEIVDLLTDETPAHLALIEAHGEMYAYDGSDLTLLKTYQMVDGIKEDPIDAISEESFAAMELADTSLRVPL